MAKKLSRPQVAAIKRKIVEFDLVAGGTLLTRTKVCGKPNCRCATDPEARHGPYYEWNRLVDGKMRHTLVSPEEASRIRQALDNRALIRELLARWERQSMIFILGPDRLRP